MKLLGRIAFALAVMFTSVGATCQNGPTAPSVQLTWTQGTPSASITANCVYRGTVAGTYALPAIYCSTTPITTYTDITVTRGTTYHYAVTAKAGTTESGYSNDASATVPTAPGAPVLGLPTESKLKNDPGSTVVASPLTARVRWK
jgi:fibronectin type 3 domain-containing protein